MILMIIGKVLFRSSHQRCSIKKIVLKNFTKFTGKHLCQSIFFNKVADLRPATLSKRRLWHRYFPVNFVIFSRKPFSQNTSERLLLLLILCFHESNSSQICPSIFVTPRLTLRHDINCKI